MPADTLLLELVTEELPPGSLASLSEALEAGLCKALAHAGLSFSSSKRFATPRRLAVVVENVADKQAEKNIEKRGPAVKAAFDDQGNPTKALQGFMTASGVSSPDALDTLQTEKGEWVIYRAVEKGQAIDEIIEQAIATSLTDLPVARRMRWGSQRDEFVRPVHRVLLMHGTRVLDAVVLGIKTGNTTTGHRFMSVGDLAVPSADAYEQILSDAFVIADLEVRKTNIRNQIESLALKANAMLEIDPDLLDEVAALVEWPVALAGEFDPAFLSVPDEALVSAMKSHQRYFHLVDRDGKLLPKFITVANIESTAPAEVVSGNERVIRPRLADAAFFFDKDRKSTLEDKLQRMKDVVFQAEIGSYYDKSQRIAQLAALLANQISADEKTCARSGLLCKADLVSDMVGEFTDLQGVMGGYYAINDDEGESVSNAITQHYRPTFSGDVLPDTPEASCVAIADKLDTLVGLFGVGQPPSGSKDPFALRRQAIGVIRICIENEVNIDLRAAMLSATEIYGKSFDIEPLYQYFLDRLGNWYVDSGVDADIYEAARASRDTILVLAEADKKIRSLQSFVKQQAAASIIAANKRVANILKKAGKIETSANPELFVEEAEASLYESVTQLQSQMQGFSNDQRLEALSGLQPIIDKYFTDVMVMADDESIRNNRISTLAELRAVFLSVADFSLIQQK